MLLANKKVAEFINIKNQRKHLFIGYTLQTYRNSNPLKK